MPITTREGLLEEWATQIEAMEQKLETLYGPPQGTPTLPTVTTREGLLEAIDEEAQKALINYAKLYGAYYNYTYAYDITLPSNLMDWYGIKKLGGRSIVMNQMHTNGDFADGTDTWGRNNSSYITMSAADNELTVKITQPGSGSSFGFRKATGYNLSFAKDHVYYVRADIYASHTDTYCYGNSTIMSPTPTSLTPQAEANTWTTCSCVFTSIATADTRPTFYQLTPSAFSAGDIYKVKNFILIDLTLAFGAGNEPTQDECDSIFSSAYYEAGKELINAGVTDIVFKDGDTVKESYTVPAEVQALTGYGMTCPNATNYIDFEEKKFYQYVGTRAYASGDESDSTVITDGTNTNYKLGAAVETDISAYLTDVPDADVQSGWDIIFQSDEDHHIPVPVQAEYIGV